MQEDPFAFWTQQLEELTPAEKREVDRLEGFARRGAVVTLNSWASALMMRYNFNRWQLIMDELGNRMRTAG